MARRVPPKEAKKPVLKPLRGQPTLEALFRSPTPPASSGTSDEDDNLTLPGPSARGTRAFKRYNIKEDTSLISFCHHLMSVDGKSKSKKVAEEIATDVSKFLRFACGDGPIPNWIRLLDRDQILAYIDKVKRAGCGPDGQIVKLDAIEAGLRFLRLSLLKDDPTNEYHIKASRISDSLQGWKATLRKQKTKKRVQRMEDLSSSSLSLDEVDQVLKCQEMWEEYTKVAHQHGGGQVSSSTLDLCTTIIATLLTFRSWQRPGAVANATLQEYKQRKEVKTGSDVMTVIRVVEHKTGLSTSAKIVLSPGDFSKLHSYVTCVRPLQDKDNNCPYLLCLSGGKQLNNFHVRFRTLTKRFSLPHLTATRVRKIAATEAALNMSGADAALITRQLSHSVETDVRFYQALSGSHHAATAFHAMEQMRKTKGEGKPEMTKNAIGAKDGVDKAEVLEERGDGMDQGKERKTTLHEENGKISQTQKEHELAGQKRRRFTQDEEEMVNLYFSDTIQACQTASLEECKTFLENHPIERSPKQIQDKVKNLIKNQQATLRSLP